MGMTAIRRLSQTLAKGIVVVIVVAMAAGLFFIGPNYGSAGPDFRYRGPAVRVNGITLKDSEFEKQYSYAAQYFSQWAAYGIRATTEQIRERALQGAIQSLVLKSEIARHKIKVPNEDVNRYYNRLAKEYFPTKDEKERFYAQNGYKGDRDFKQAIRDYLAEIYLYLYLSQSEDKTEKIDVEVTETEIEEAYASIDLHQIVLSTREGVEGALTEAEAKKKAEEVYAKLRDGGDWDELVKEYSNDPLYEDGKMGEYKVAGFKQQAPYGQAFVDAALALKEGEFSEPIRTDQGYHIIRMAARKEASGPDFEKEKRMIHAELIRSKFQNDQEKFGKWIEARVNEADVTILDPALRAYQLRTEAQSQEDEAKAKEKWDQAAEFYLKAVKMRKHRWYRDMFISAIDTFLHQKMYDEAIDTARRATKLFTMDTEMFRDYGKALYLRAEGKDKIQGKAMLEKAVELAGEDRFMLGSIKEVYEELELTEEAKKLQETIDDIAAREKAEQERLEKELAEEQARAEAEAEQEEAESDGD